MSPTASHELSQQFLNAGLKATFHPGEHAPSAQHGAEVIEFPLPRVKVFCDSAAGAGRSQLELALDLARRGYAVLPCGPDKKPLLSKEEGGNGYQDATRDPAKIREWWGRWPDAWIGVCPGRCAPAQIVLDVDVKNDQPGMDSLADLEIEQVAAPTRTVRTPSGGLHLWYLRAAGVPEIDNRDLAPGINVRADRGYVIWYGEGEGEATVAPPALIERLADRKPTREKAIDAGKLGLPAEPPEPLQAERLDRLRADHPREFDLRGDYDGDQSRQDLALADLACRRGLPPLDAWRLIIAVRDDDKACRRDYIERTLSIPYGERAATIEEMKAKVREQQEKAAQQQKETAEPKRQRPGPVSARELATRPAPAPKPYVWAGLLPQDHVTMLYGDGGIGKGRVAMEVAVACAAGVGELFGHAIKPMPAMFVSVEDDEDELRRRAEEIAARHGKTLADLDLHIWSLVGEDTILATIRDNGEVTLEDFYEHLAEELVARFSRRRHFLVLDALAGLVVLDETKRAPTRACASRVLAPLCKEAGSTGLVLAHPSKASMQDGTYYAGSTDWNNAFRNRLIMELIDKYGPGHFTVKLSRAKTNIGVGGQELTLWSAPGSVALSDMPPQEAAASGQEERETVLGKVIELTRRGDRVTIDNRSSGIGPRSLAKALGLDGKRVQEHLEAIRVTGRLRYRNAGSHTHAGFILPDFPTDAPRDQREDARRQAMTDLLEARPGENWLSPALAGAIADETGDAQQALLPWLDAIAKDPEHPLNKRHFAGTTTARAGQQWCAKPSAQEN